MDLINLSLCGYDLGDEKLHRLTGELCTTINQQTNFEASLASSKEVVGTKGDPVTIGQIALGILGTGGAAVALINVFKSYIDRNRELSIKLKKKSGDEIEITSKNIDLDEIVPTLRQFLTKS